MEKQPGNFSTMNSSLPKPTIYAGGLLALDADEWTFLIPTLLVLICLIGLAGNLCVIAILLHNARKSKPSFIHSLILNLSLSDLLLLMFSVPFKAAAYSRYTFSWGWFVCRTADWFAHSCMSVKSITMAIVARACFMYASNPAKQVNIRQLVICGVIVCTWLVAAILPLPECFFTDVKQIDGSFLCLLTTPAQTQELMEIFVKLYPIAVYCIPFTVAFFYFWKAHAQCQRRGTKTQNLRNQIRSKRLTMMLLSVSVTSALLWLPEWVSWLWIWHQPLSVLPPPQAFVSLAQILMFSLSCINPLIFLLMSEEFKEGYKEVWKRLTSKKPLAVQDIQDQGALNSEVLPDSTPSPGADPDQPPTSGFMEHSCSQQNFGSQDSKDNPVLPDVEQFWHEREAHPDDHDNDPIPWEHQDQNTVSSDKCNGP